MACDDSQELYRIVLIQLLDIRVERDRETSVAQVFAAHISRCGETWLESAPKILHSSIVSVELHECFASAYTCQKI